MRAISLRSMIFSCILSLLVLSSFSTSAFASTDPGNGTSSCPHLYIHLNGTQPATRICLDSQGISARSDCAAADIELILWWDAGYKYNNICFSGIGSTDLGSYPKPALVLCSDHTGIFCTSWNDNASSYDMSGTSTVKSIYTDIAGNGVVYSGTTEHGNFGDTPVGNDNASSITIEPVGTK